MNLIEFCTDKIVKGYSLSRFCHKFDYSGVKLLLEAFPDRFVSYKNSVVVFLRLTQESFDKLKSGRLDLKDWRVLLPLFREHGNHIHVLGVVSDSVRDLLFLARYLKDDSISWFVPDMSRLVVFERS